MRRLLQCAWFFLPACSPAPVVTPAPTPESIEAPATGIAEAAFHRGTPPGSTRDFEKKCIDGDNPACRTLADEVWETDRARAGRLLFVACRRSKDAETCNDAGRALFSEDFDPENGALAYQIACDAGLQVACSNLAYCYAKGLGVRPNSEKAERLYTIACNGDDPGACGDLAGFYLFEKRQIPEERLVALMARACEGGWPHRCTHLGQWRLKGLFIEQNLERAEHWLRLGCDGGVQDGCTDLSLLSLETDLKIPLPASQVVTHLVDACDKEVERACIPAYQLQKEGRGIEADLDLALESLSIGCRLAAEDERTYPECSQLPQESQQAQPTE